jgi:hypothetical protein
VETLLRRSQEVLVTISSLVSDAYHETAGDGTAATASGGEPSAWSKCRNHSPDLSFT